MKDVQKVIGRNLRYYRYKAKKSQEAFYPELKKDPKYYANIELGKVNMTIGLLNDLSEALGIPITEFFNEDPSRIVKKKRVDEKK